MSNRSTIDLNEYANEYAGSVPDDAFPTLVNDQITEVDRSPTIETPAVPAAPSMGAETGESKAARPAWLEEKYRDEAHFVECHKNLEKRLGAGLPAKYEIGAEINAEDPSLREFLDYAKSTHMSQEMVSKALNVSASVARSLKVDEKRELERLGPEGAVKMRYVENWATNNLSGTGRDAFSKMPKTAEMINLMNEVRLMQSEDNVPTPNSHAIEVSIPMTSEALEYEMMNNMNKFHTDPVYREQMRAKLAKSLARESGAA